MGCYGIGVGRLMASVIEARHDDCGPLWPLSMAPFQVQLIALNLDIEWKSRDNTEKGFIPMAETVRFVSDFMKKSGP